MPIVYNKNIDDHSVLAIWKIEETEEEMLAGLQLKQHELDIISSFNNGKRLLHWLSTRLLLRKMLNTTAYIDCQFDEDGKPYLVNSDYQMLAIIIHNLIDNATKFTENGMLIISSEKIQDKVHVIFSNNGSPISEELLNMFNEDSVLNNSSTIGRKTGLGFLIVKEIAALIHVQLTVNQTDTTNFHLIFDSSL